MSFEELEHTADVRLRVKASTLEGLFSEAARAMMVVMYGSAEPGPMRRKIEVRAPDLESLMHAFLSEILYVSEVEDMVVSGAEVILSEGRVEGDLAGEPFSSARHRGGMEIKGISLSGLKVYRDNHTYILEVIFDV
ncbi:MAG TPA: archease [Methanoregulaceae archaeon]|nr:MAG: archease [Methanolinea sp.]HON82014.1 archease [Methanoregulaceae archaeon]HPD11095.1 archease [Methanoregulaceae archaeon]HRT15932.1 archease [Methanoregulaceae archaeon]HRU31397.1 archease [Methanoregulaceae archaeon]